MTFLTLTLTSTSDARGCLRLRLRDLSLWNRAQAIFTPSFAPAHGHADLRRRLRGAVRAEPARDLSSTPRGIGKQRLASGSGRPALRVRGAREAPCGGLPACRYVNEPGIRRSGTFPPSTARQRAVVDE